MNVTLVKHLWSSLGEWGSSTGMTIIKATMDVEIPDALVAVQGLRVVLPGGDNDEGLKIDFVQYHMPEKHPDRFGGRVELHVDQAQCMVSYKAPVGATAGVREAAMNQAMRQAYAQHRVAGWQMDPAAMPQ